MQNPKVIDADGHIYENHEEIEEYFEDKYRGMRRARAYALFPSLDGWPRGLGAGPLGGSGDHEPQVSNAHVLANQFTWKPKGSLRGMRTRAMGPASTRRASTMQTSVVFSA